MHSGLGAHLLSLLHHDQYRLKVLIPDTFVYKDGKFHCHLFSDDLGEIRQSKRTLLLASQRKILTANVPRGDRDKPAGLLRFDDHNVRLIRSDSLDTVFALLNKKSESSVSQWQFLHSYKAASQNKAYICTYRHDAAQMPHAQNQHSTPQKRAWNAGMAGLERSKHFRVSKVHTEVYRFSKQYLDFERHPMIRRPPGEENPLYDSPSEFHVKQPLDINKVPASVLRECERATIGIVTFLERIHGFKVLSLTLEFIQCADPCGLMLFDIPGINMVEGSRAPISSPQRASPLSRHESLRQPRTNQRTDFHEKYSTSRDRTASSRHAKEERSSSEVYARSIIPFPRLIENLRQNRSEISRLIAEADTGVSEALSATLETLLSVYEVREPAWERLKRHTLISFVKSTKTTNTSVTSGIASRVLEPGHRIGILNCGTGDVKIQVYTKDMMGVVRVLDEIKPKGVSLSSLSVDGMYSPPGGPDQVRTPEEIGEILEPILQDCSSVHNVKFLAVITGKLRLAWENADETQRQAFVRRAQDVFEPLEVGL